jgi:hypothetical protein
LRQSTSIAEEDEIVSAIRTIGTALRAGIILLGCVVGAVFTFVSIYVVIEEPLPLTHFTKQEYEALYLYALILYFAAGGFINLVALILSIFSFNWHPMRWVKPTAIILNLIPIILSILFLVWAGQYGPEGTS